MERIETDILVVGGGIAGLAATGAFAAEGFSALCVDPVPPPAEMADPGSDLRSTAFLMPSVRLLERAGLWAPLLRHAAPLRIMRIADAGGPEPRIRATADFVADEVGQTAFGFNIPNWLLRKTFSDTLAGIPGARLHYGASLQHLTARTRGAIARLSDGTTVGARLVIGADGRDSGLRELLGIGRRRWEYGQKAIVFTVSHAEPHNGISTEIHRTGGPFTLVPLPDVAGQPHSAVVWMERGPRAMDLAAMDSAAFEAALDARACGVLGHLTLVSPRRVWPIISQVADRLDGPRAALVAEAAHVIPPIGAQGLNMSLRDIAVLRDRCVEARDAASDFGESDLLRRYHWQRHPDILARVSGVDALNRAAMQENQGLRDLRFAGLRALHGLRPIRRGVMSLGLGAGA
jgi:2-octaprenyl-6-methoxyphenol hydroxylase